jgi:hypothetical protein
MYNCSTSADRLQENLGLPVAPLEPRIVRVVPEFPPDELVLEGDAADAVTVLHCAYGSRCLGMALRPAPGAPDLEGYAWFWKVHIPAQ